MRRALLILLGAWLGAAAPPGRAEPPPLSLRAGEDLAAFTPDHPPQIGMTVWKSTAWHGFILVDRFDLLSEKTTVDYLSASTSGTGTETLEYTPKVAFGIYRIDCALVESRDENPKPEASLTFAYAPARDPHQLPDDWPLGAHVTFDDPPLPGFKWYRYFSSWAEDNPARGRFDWSRLDQVFARVQAIGGKLLIANDTTPSWTAPGRPVTRPWVKSSTAYPPDDMNDFRGYLDALLQRFDDKAGTIGGLEDWNEANTPDRWMGTPQQMVAMAKIFREAAAASAQRVQRGAPARIVGIAVSSGHQQDYVNAVIKAGILPYLDVVSGHWYEEMLSYDRATPFNSLPLHVDLLAEPMHAAGAALPIWNSESGIGCVPRENGRLVPQDELNRRAVALPKFNPKQPWLLDGVRWRNVSERRAAASFVAGTAMLMALGVEKTFVYSMRDEGWILDGAPSLAWIALGEFGDQIHALDFHTIVPVKARVEGGDPSLRVLAYRFGIGPKSVVIAWCYQQDATVGRPKLWQPWLNPQPVRLDIDSSAVEVTDLYGRETQTVSAADGGITIPIGEEPVYIRESLSP